MKSVFTFALLICFTILSAQPKMTLWRVFGAHDHTQGDSHQQAPELYECGSYYFFVSDGVVESSWTIKNEGSSNLELQLPLGFDPNAATSMEISQQPSKSVLAPGEEAIFKIHYDFYGIHGDFFLDIESNDTENGSCGLLVGGNVLACTCYCTTGGIAQSVGFCSKGVGTVAGIPLFEEPCDTPTSNDTRVEGETCQPISIADPCSCDNTITTTGGELLYRDTMRVITLSNTVLFLTDNNMGFLDRDGNMVPSGTALTTADASGLVTHIFYREPGQGVNVTINGVPFINTNVCPDASTCNPVANPIPTVGEWGLITLALLFLIFSVVAIKVGDSETLEAS